MRVAGDRRGHEPAGRRRVTTRSPTGTLLFDVNVRATFLVCQAFGDALLTRGVAGSIVNDVLADGLGRAIPAAAAYCATKHAVNGLTRALWPSSGRRTASASTRLRRHSSRRPWSRVGWRTTRSARRCLRGYPPDGWRGRGRGARCSLPRVRRVGERDRAHPRDRRWLDRMVKIPSTRTLEQQDAAHARPCLRQRSDEAKCTSAIWH